MLWAVASVAARAETPAEQYALAERFVCAHFSQDNAVVRTCIPTDNAAMFMAYPFAAPPSLSAPKVHKNQAVIEFSGPMLDNKLPTRGGIIFYKSPIGWRVRQVLFYNKIPSVFGFPSHSVTGADRAQEARVIPICQGFMDAWQKHNMGTVLAYWSNWPIKNDSRVKGLTFSHFQGQLSRTAWGDPYVAFSVKVTYHFGPFSYSMTVRGGVILVQTPVGLRVRGNHLVLLF
jgi:hypothetical protein